MRVNKLKSLMKTMAEKAGLDAKHLTNQSGRKRMIQKLNDEGVPPKHIMQISGHKNVQSPNNYSTLSKGQKKKHFQHSEWTPRNAGAIRIPSRYFQCFQYECN